MCSLTGHWPLIVSRQSLTIEVYPFFGQHIPDGGVGRARRCVLRYFHFSVYGVVIVADVLVGFLPLERGYGTELTEFPAFFLQIFAQLAAQAMACIFSDCPGRVFMRFCSQMILPVCEFREKRGSASK